MAPRSIISFLTHAAPPADGGPATLAQALDARVREGELIERLEGGAVRCFACGHRCLVKLGRRGICKVRFNKDGTLLVPAGYVAALQSDREETVLPRPSRIGYAHVRDAGLRLPLRLLPELAHQPGAARRRGGRAADRRHPRRPRPPGAAPGGPHARLLLQ